MKKKYIITCLILIIPLFLISCKNEVPDIPISLNNVDINAISNDNLLKIINDNSLKDGVYLIQTKSNQYIYFQGKKNSYNNITCSLENKTLIITANIEKSSNHKKLYLINQKNITSSDKKSQFYDKINLIINDKEASFSGSIIIN